MELSIEGSRHTSLEQGLVTFKDLNNVGLIWLLAESINEVFVQLGSQFYSE